MRTWCMLLTLTACATFPSLMAYGQLSDSGTLPGRIDISDQFEETKREFQDLTWEAWQARIPQPVDQVERLELSSGHVDFLGAVQSELSLDDQDIQQLKDAGLLLLDPQWNQSFPAAYYNLYTRDLPVLITCDSILHAFHHSYDKILLELESNYLRTSLDSLLSKTHKMLENFASDVRSPELQDICRDVDLYLTVARSLLAANASKAEEYVPSKMDQDDSVQRVLDLINSPEESGVQRVRLYGSEREIDFTQFQVRGHYSRSRQLSSYFRCMAWLGRADCGWNILSPGKVARTTAAETRELRGAALLVQLVQSADVAQEYASIENVLQFMVGDSDNLTVRQLWAMVDSAGIRTVNDLTEDTKTVSLQHALLEQPMGLQTVRSQVVRPTADASTIERLPQIFQLFGQRFTIDSFILSNVVHDSILFKGTKSRRSMPSGLDAMAGLGNDLSIQLLQRELETWNYSGNLAALRQLIAELPSDYWHQNIYAGWLGALRDLNDDLTEHAALPQVFRTEAWRKKQLQTQLASWSELRHDTILYAKASYSAPSCEFPVAYVEPYPDFFTTLERVAIRSAETLQGITPPRPRRRGMWGAAPQKVQSYADFFTRMATHFAKLSQIAKKEIAQQALTDDEILFLKRTISQKGSRVFGGSGFANITIYDGWYTELLFGFDTDEQKKWRATIADVHTDLDNSQALQVGVGPVNYCVIVADDGKCNKAFVGPTYSYYEFKQPLYNRLSDQQWQSKLQGGDAPPRPGFIRPLVGGAGSQMLPVVTTFRESQLLHVFDGEQPITVWSKKQAPKFALDQDGLGKLAGAWPRVRHLDLSDTRLDDEDLRPLSALRQIRAIDLSGTQIRGKGLAYLANSQYLRGLKLNDTRVDDESLKLIPEWRYLEELDLNDTSITDDGLSHLSHSLYLRRLHLGGTAVTETGIQELQIALPDCKIVSKVVFD
jgi:hypothetical protein